jgi:hypothetical protein
VDTKAIALDMVDLSEDLDDADEPPIKLDHDR